MKRVALVALAAVGCASAAVPAATETARPVESRRAAPRLRAPEVELFYKDDKAWARRGSEEWPLGDVMKAEMVFSPDRKKFAYVRQKPKSMHVLVRNLAGDPINEFPVYRPGSVDELSWLDNHRIGYVAPPEAQQPGKKPGPPFTYVVHDVNTGEVLAARSGAEPVFGPEKKHVAFVAGSGARQAVVVDGQNVWPRYGSTKIHGAPVWSPDGHGIAFTDEGAAGPRLVVLVEFDDAQGDLTWPIPRDALAPGLHVFWAGDNKVVIGETGLKPRFAADWQRLR
jgi:hypothetical protein